MDTALLTLPSWGFALVGAFAFVAGLRHAVVRRRLIREGVSLPVLSAPLWSWMLGSGYAMVVGAAATAAALTQGLESPAWRALPFALYVGVGVALAAGQVRRRRHVGLIDRVSTVAMFAAWPLLATYMSGWRLPEVAERAAAGLIAVAFLAWLVHSLWWTRRARREMATLQPDMERLLLESDRRGGAPSA